MPASIILSNLSLSTPDGRPLLSDLKLTFCAERAGLVGRNGVGRKRCLLRSPESTFPKRDAFS